MERTLYPGKVWGQVDIPASNSQTIRAIFVALLARGVSVIHTPSTGSDIQAALDFCRQLGAKVSYKYGTLTIDSTYIDLSADIKLDCHSSGTTLYLATAIACVLGIKVSFTGDSSLVRRPVRPLLSSLQDLGSYSDPIDCDHAPYTIQGPLNGGHTSIRCITSQYLSALLLACPLAKQDTTIDVLLLREKPYVLMTEGWLNAQGIEYFRDDEMTHYTVRGNQSYKPFEKKINGDFSSATFFFCAAAITGGTVTVNGLDINSSQADREILPILQKMGCSVRIEGKSITLTGPSRLTAADFDLNGIPNALPALAVTGSFASGPVKLYNDPQARLKKNDRIRAMAKIINELGGQAQELPDGIVVYPVSSFHGGTVSSFGDSTIAMASALTSLKCNGTVTIQDSECVEMTFPSFFDTLASVTYSHN